MRGVPGAAKFISHDGVNGNEKPIWMVSRSEAPLAPAAGMVILQPGSYSDVHWITRSSTDPRASLVADECDKQKAGQLEDQALTAVNEVCEGWFLEIRAVKSVAFEHGGEIIPVRPGTDNRSHLNMVTSYRSPPLVEITPQRENSPSIQNSYSPQNHRNRATIQDGGLTGPAFQVLVTVGLQVSDEGLIVGNLHLEFFRPLFRRAVLPVACWSTSVVGQKRTHISRTDGGVTIALLSVQPQQIRPDIHAIGRLCRY